MLNLLKKYSKVLISVLAVVLVLGGVYALYTYRTRSSITCDDKLASLPENRLCIKTSKGIMVFELYQDGGPKAIERLKSLSNEKKFYDGLEFYRVATDFVIQGGIQDFAARTSEYNIAGNSSLREKAEMLGKDAFEVETNFTKLGFTQEQGDALVQEGYKSDDNINARKFEYGSISFANNGPAGNSTEIFIVSSKKDDDETLTQLDGKFTNFGKIIEGQDVLDAINSIPADKNYPLELSQDQSKPSEKVEIYEVRVK